MSKYKYRAKFIIFDFRHFRNVLILVLLAVSLMGQSPEGKQLFIQDSLYKVIMKSGQKLPTVLAAVKEYYQKSVTLDQGIIKKLDELIAIETDANKAKLLEIKGFVYYATQDYQTADRIFEQSYQFYQKSNQQNIPSILSKLGSVKNLLGRNEEAVKYYLIAIETAKKFNNLKEVSYNYNNLANLLVDLGKVEESEKYYDLALEVEKKSPDPYLAANVYMSKGLNAMELNKLEIAKKHLNKSIQLFDSLGLSDKFTAKNNLALVLEKAEESQQAWQLYKEIEYHFRAEDNKLGLARVLYDQGMYHLSLKNYAKATKECEKSRDIYIEINDVQALKDCYFCLYKANKFSGNNLGALQNYENYIMLSDSISNQSNLQQITEIQKNYEFKAERERLLLENTKKIEKEKYSKRLMTVSILVLFVLLIFTIIAYMTKQKTNKIITNQKKELERYNTSNENLIFSLSHDIREPMLGAQLLLKAIVSDDPILKNAKLSIENQITSINSIVSNLLQIKRMSFVNQNESCSWGEIQEIIQKVIIQSKYKLDEKNLTVDNLSIEKYNINFPISSQKLFLILLNIMNNAIKYSPNQSNIEIWCDESGIYIRDHGPGISDEILAKVGKENIIHNNNEINNFGMGLYLVNNLLVGSKMKLQFENHKNGGAIASLIYYK